MRRKMAFQYKYYILAVANITFSCLAPPHVFHPVALRQTMYYLIFQGLFKTFMPNV